VLVVPAFEEGRLREKLRLPIEVRIWQEDQSLQESRSQR